MLGPSCPTVALGKPRGVLVGTVEQDGTSMAISKIGCPMAPSFPELGVLWQMEGPGHPILEIAMLGQSCPMVALGKPRGVLVGHPNLGKDVPWDTHFRKRRAIGHPI